MTFPVSQRIYPILLFLLLLLIGCAPIWSVEYFVNQDGSPHLYNAYLMSEILRGNQAVSNFVTFNSIAVPNSTGHWLLAGLLQVFDPLTATKVIVTLTFAGLVAGAGWLRWRVRGEDGLLISLMAGGVLAFNWMWFVGFYNFTIGVIAFAFIVGLYYGWRGELTVVRVTVLSLLLMLVYWSHLVSFAATAGTVILLAIIGDSPSRKSTVLRTCVAFLPIIPLIVLFRSVSEAGGGFSPNWRVLGETMSVKLFLMQVISTDPFVIISRKTFPFSSVSSSWMALFSPFFVAAASFAGLSVASLRTEHHRHIFRQLLPFAIGVAGALLAAAFAPDDFGLANGGILRERILLCGLFLFIPLIASNMRSWWNRLAIVGLVYVFLFQTAATWQYAMKTDADAREFLTAKNVIPEGAAVASIVVVKSDVRFQVVAAPQMNTLNGIGRNIRIWDNYEIGHYLFPLVAVDAADRAFVHELTQSNAFDTNDTREDPEVKLNKMIDCMASNHSKIDVLVTWDADQRILDILGRWFQTEPFFVNGRVRLYRHL